MNASLRQHLKKYYQQKRQEDGIHVGRRLDAISQGLHYQFKAAPQDRDIELIKKSVEELEATKKEPRFRDDFPTFSSFVKFYKKEKLNLSDLVDDGIGHT